MMVRIVRLGTAQTSAGNNAEHESVNVIFSGTIFFLSQRPPMAPTKRRPREATKMPAQTATRITVLLQSFDAPLV